MTARDLRSEAGERRPDRTPAADAKAYLAACTRRVDARLEAMLPPADTPPPALHAAMRHLVFPGGKRLRPALAFAGAEAAAGAPADALDVAVAVELVHTWSLIHDDLPCMDDDDLRRGRPSVHVAFGEATAVLAGDALLALAFEVLCASDGGGERALRSAAELARACGARGLVGGQVDDLAGLSEHGDATAAEDVHRRKTAALMAAAVTGGARAAGADEAVLVRIRRYGEATGVAFQIADDLLDRDDDDGVSLVRVLGAERARARAEALLEQALREAAPLGPAAEPLRMLARYAVRRDR